MSGDYHVLAQFHKEVGISQFGGAMIGDLLNFVQLNGWSGRNILDAGCGTGEALTWLAQYGYILTGVDRSSAMLSHAEAALRASQFEAQLRQDNLTDLNIGSEIDLVVALDVLHEMNSLREFGSVLEAFYNALASEKYLVFDVLTIEGLIQRRHEGGVLHDDNALMVVGQDLYDYERQIHQRTFTIFAQTEDCWQRHEARLTLRAYPIQAITTLLQRTGFEVLHLLDAALQAYEPTLGAERVIIVARKR